MDVIEININKTVLLNYWTDLKDFVANTLN